MRMIRPTRSVLPAPRGLCLALLAALAAGLLASPARSADPGPAAASGKKKIVFVAGTPSHGYGAHEHNAGCLLLAKCLNEHLGGAVETKVYQNGWPKEADAFDGADAVVMYCDGGNGHMVLPHLQELDALAKKGVGVGCIHYAVEPGDGKKQPDGRAEFLDWIGGYFETFYSINPTWVGDFKELPHHPVTTGVRPFRTHDEWYYHMRFRPEMKGVTPILSAVPPDSTRQGKDDAHGGNPAVREGVGKNTPETTLWVSERPVEGGQTQRGFGCTGGHSHWNWAQDDFRKCVLNCILWVAKADVPAGGVVSTTPTIDDLMANQDEKLPANFNKEQQQKQIEAMNHREEK